jgi:DNA-binding PadR family transcriptional regulator
VSKETGRTMSDAQVHVALSRMEGRGFVRVVEGGVSTTSRTRGRPRKFYEITDGGRAALHASIGYLEATAIVSAEDETECVISGP